MSAKKKKQRSRARVLIDTTVYCVAVILVFFSVVLFLQEFEYVPDEVYADPPPAAPQTMPVPAPTATPEPVYTAEVSIEPAPTAYVSPSVAETVEAKPTDRATPRPSASATVVPTAAPTPQNDTNSQLHPVKLYFINKRISCNVRPVGLTSKYEMETIRSAYDVGWLSSAPYVLPGDIGKAIIAGHNRWSGHNGSFSVLKKIEPGEEVAVEMSDGYARYFVVDEVTECAYDDNSIMEPVYDRAVLVLITCKGDWDSVLHMSRTRVIAICSPKQ